MTFTIIGTGNIAWFFGKRLAAAGHQCRGVFGRNPEKVKELSDTLLATRSGTMADFRDEESDVCFLAVSDKAVSEVAQTLSMKHTILVHVAGALPIEAITGAAKDCAVLWPVYSIQKSNAPAHRNIPMAWEVTSDRAKRYVLEMAHAITDELFDAKHEQRKWLHLAAVFTNNFVNHLMSINELLCKENNVPIAALNPLFNQTFEKLKQASPKNIQTGPAIRNDEETVARHLEMLEGKKELQQVYKAITDSIHAMHTAPAESK